MKKQFLLFVLTLLPLLSHAKVVIGGIYYNLYADNNTAEVTSNPNKYMGDVVIPSTVTYSGITYSITSIVQSAFRGCSGLTSVTIGNGVTSIGEGAFYECSGLTSVTIPNSVTSIGDWAFAYCSGLTSVTIPNSVTSIGGGAFCGCRGLTSVTIGNGVTSIGGSAFSGCRGLTSVTIPSSVTSIGSSAFSACSGLTSVTIPNSVTSIGEGAFRECSGLTSVTIPNSVTSIGNYAFAYCSGLTSVTIPNSVTSIGGRAFEGCSSLTSVTIPNSVTSIGYWAFAYCSGLTSVTIPNSVTSIGGGAFSDCRGLTSVTIPNSVTTIGSSAFAYCSGLTSVTIGNGVTSIGNSAFMGCENLLTVNSLIEAPFNCGRGAFDETTCRNGTLYVPIGTKELYTRFDGWRNFLKIVEMGDASEQKYLTLKDGEHGQMMLAVKIGENYTLRFVAEDGWHVHSVSFNGDNVTAEVATDGTYTTPAITENSILNVVYAQGASSVASLKDNLIHITSFGETLTVSGTKGGERIAVYTLDGKTIISMVAQNENTELSLPGSGTYIVNVNGSVYKVAL